ncbi:LamG-like jellyroll fold domain-containing protein, partial [Planctomycetota bacterium]
TRWDLVVSTRATTDELWSLPVSVGAAINNGTFNYNASISNDGLKLYFDSNRTGGHGGYDIWVTTRPNKGANWGTPVNLGPSFNTSGNDGYPCISSDGLEFYFSSTTRAGGHGGSDIWVAKRQTQDDDWGTPENLGPLVNKSGDDSSPHLSPDGLKLFFNDETDNICMTQRRSIAESWEASVQLGQPLNSSYSDVSPRVSPDGRILYFASHRPAVYKLESKGWHVFEAPIIPIVDFNGDGTVDAADMCIIVDNWGTDYSLCDIGPTPLGDGIVDVQDLIVLSEHLFEKVNDPALVAHWALDETEGMFTADSAGDNDAFVTGGTAWQPSSGQEDGALQLNGIDGCAIAGPVLNPADGPFSLLAWVNGGAPGQVIVSQQGFADWLTADAEGNLMTELKCTGRSVGPLFSEAVITDGQWHRIGLVWDGSNRTLCVDGVVVAEDTQPGLEGSQMGLYIGTGKAMETGTYFSGLMDDVRIYDVAISAEQIVALAQ